MSKKLPSAEFSMGTMRSLCFPPELESRSVTRYASPQLTAKVLRLTLIQIPAIAFPEVDKLTKERHADNSGITIVVSPLIALMKDQVDALKRKGIAAECMDSTKTWDELQQINKDLREGKLRILYCAPERLNNEGFVGMMKHVKGGVRLIGVDEAHCISEV